MAKQKKENAVMELLMQLTEAKAILKYTLLLPESNCEMPSIDLDDDDSIRAWVDALAEITLKACKALFPTGSGYLFSDANLRETIDTENLAYLDDDYFWKFIFKQQMILSAYEQVRKMVSAQYNISGSALSETLYYHQLLNMVSQDDDTEEEKFIKLAKYLKAENREELSSLNGSSIYGLFKLCMDHNGDFPVKAPLAMRKTKLNAWNIEAREISEEISNQCDASRVKMTSNCNTLYTALYKNSPYAASLKITTNEAFNAGSIFRQYNALELSQLALGKEVEVKCVEESDSQEAKKQNANGIKTLITAFSGSRLNGEKFDRFCDRYNAAIKELAILPDGDELGGVMDSSMELADRVYGRYLMEKVIPVSLADFLYNVMEEGDELSEFLSGNFDELSECALLPNALSREYILKILFDTLPFRARKIPSFTESATGGLYRLEFVETKKDTERYRIYLNRFVSAVNILSQLAFPTFNSYFFNLLWDTVKDDDTSDEQCIKKIFLYLSKYLNDFSNVEMLLYYDAYAKKQPKIGSLQGASMGIAFKPFSTGLTYDAKKTINYSLYQKCLRATIDIGKRVPEEKENKVPSPDWLSLEQVNSLSDKLGKYIREQVYDVTKGHVH